MKWSADGHDDVQWGDSYLAFLGRKFMRLVVLLLLQNIFAIWGPSQLATVSHIVKKRLKRLSVIAAGQGCLNKMLRNAVLCQIICNSNSISNSKHVKKPCSKKWCEKCSVKKILNYILEASYPS